MHTPMDAVAREAEISLQGLLPRLESRFGTVAGVSEWESFKVRLHRHFPDLFRLLLDLYGRHYDFFFHLESVLQTAAEMWLERPFALKQLDKDRDADPLWFQSEKMLGGVCYVDLFAGDLEGVRRKIPSFK